MQSPLSRAHLEAESVASFWQGVSQVLARLLNEMDRREPWVIDQDDNVLDMIASLVERLEDSAFATEATKGDGVGRLAHVLALLQSSRFMRLLEMFDKRQPGMVSRLTLTLSMLGGESEVFAQLFYERLLAIHRAELLGQVFSVERGNRIAQDIEMIREVM